MGVVDKHKGSIESHDGIVGTKPSLFMARPATLAPLLAVVACVIFCLNGELLQALQVHTPPGEQRASPGVNLLFCHLGGLIFLPQFGFLDFSQPSASTRLVSGQAGFASHFASRPRIAALFFAFLLMGYNYFWIWSAKWVAVAVTNATFQTSVGFVYAASVPLFGESLRTSKVVGVAMVVFGSLMASGILGSKTVMPNASESAFSVTTGIGLALLAAIGMALYQVLFRYVFGHLKHDVRFLAFFSAWVSVWHVLVMFPLLIFVGQVGGEAFQLPRGHYTVLGTFISACLASTVNVLYLCIALWGTPMLLPCSNVFSVPLTIILDATLHGVYPNGMEIIGHAMVVAAVVLILSLHEQLFPGATTAASNALKSAYGKQSDVVDL